MMYNWRVTKYNPINRNNEGVYTKTEWTSIYDIGKYYFGKKFTIGDYLTVENSYINAILLFMNSQNIHHLDVSGLERHEEIEYFKEAYTKDMINMHNTIKNGDTVTIEEVPNLCRLVLRENLWCKLEHKTTMFVHFGYDYYVYIGSELNDQSVLDKIRRSGLFVEEFISPYYN